MSDVKCVLYRTSDIYFAAYLCSIDIPLQASEKEDNGHGRDRVVWVFKVPSKDGVGIKRMKAAYFGGTATVKARRFVDNLKSLKSMCFV
jgi:hypothetical protein